MNEDLARCDREIAEAYTPAVRPWEREFFFLAAHVLSARLASLDPGPLADGTTYCPVGLIVGELSYGAEMHLVLRETGMLRRQRLAYCAAALFNGQCTPTITR
jgi:hypothetical protein